MLLTFNYFVIAQANVNGYISFNDGAIENFPSLVPTSKHMVVSAFWNKIDITKSDGGNVYFRPSTKHTDLKKASMQIRNEYTDQQDYEASWVLVVTWYKVPYYSQGNRVML